MKTHNPVTLALAVLLSGCGGLKHTPTQITLVPTAAESVVDTATAESAVAGFHTHFNAQNFEAIYSSAHAEFKAAMSKDDLLALFESKRNKLGKVEKSTRIESHNKSGSSTTNLVLTYSTTFENGSRKEVFIYGFEGEKVSLIGWHVGTDTPS